MLVGYCVACYFCEVFEGAQVFQRLINFEVGSTVFGFTSFALFK